ncbi:hypothetical protein [Ammoniphilus sp. CFH 90114]|uniref:hypothetical protein n=1 Tax=Ammoniphilus sp. CFH 90114 TaxID=2493665 RepID=UPI00100FC003|nr:hypothetical protein [Ammoniphilus sp. CFH 90114]RXT01915.1 hypothetical protein EIZ39_25305 [Ammoniphilus sp. CFH 90114]
MSRIKIGLSLLALVLLWVGNMTYYQRHQLDEPLFMKHYYNIVTLGNQLNFELYYLVNQREDVGIYRLHLPDSEIDLYPTWEHDNNHSQYHKLKNARFEWDEVALESLKDDMQIREIEVEFTNGSRKLVDIGEILIRKTNEDPAYIHSQSSGSSSDNTGFSHYRQKEELKFIGLKHLPPQLDAKYLSFQVNGQHVEVASPSHNLDFKPYLEVKYAFHFPQDDPRAQNIYSSMSELEVQTPDGQIKEGLMFINYTPNWSTADIRAILRERRAK